MRRPIHLLALLAVAVVVVFLATRFLDTDTDQVSRAAESENDATGSGEGTPLEAVDGGDPLDGVGTPPVDGRDAIARDRLEIVGRVIERDSEERLEGFEITLRCRDGGRSSTTSAADGSFRLEAPDATDDCVLGIVRREGFETPDGFDLDPSALLDEYVFRVHRIAAATLGGRVVDANTDELVPFLPFELSSEYRGRGEPVETDEEGRFRTQGELSEGKLYVHVRDQVGAHDALPTRVDHLVDGAEPADHEIRLKIGPTYVLDVELPPGVTQEDLIAELDGEVASTATPWNRTLRQTHVRVGEPPWVRFHEPEFFEEPAPPWVLSLATKDGSWRGGAVVDAITGVYTRPVTVRLSRKGVLTGALHADEGDVEWAFLELLAPDGKTTTHGPFTDGTYRIDWLEPGRYRLSGEARQHVCSEIEVDVREKEPTTFDPTFERLPSPGSISGVVRSETASSEADLRVVVRTDRHARLVWTTPVVWGSEPGEGTFHFDGLPQGEYTVILSVGIVGRADPERIVASPPADDLEFVYLDDPASSREYEIRALDAKTGECIEGPELETRRSPAEPGFRSWTSGCWLWLGGARAPDESIEWVLRCAGYESAWGDETLFTEERKDKPGRWRGEVELRRGWSGRVAVRDESGAPLSAAEIVIDGDPTGATDDTGRVVVYRESRPASLVIRYADWRIVAGDVDPSDGSFADSGFEIAVVVAPPE